MRAALVLLLLLATTASCGEAGKKGVAPQQAGESTTTTLHRGIPPSEQALLNEFSGRILTITHDADHILVGVAANEEELAAELDRRDGVRVVAVGALAFPLESATPVCDTIPASVPDSYLGLQVDVEATPNVPAQDLSTLVKVRLHNVGSERVQFSAGYPEMFLLTRDGEVGSARVASSPGIAISVDLAPGESMVMDATADFNSCDPELGYLLPPGEYELVALIPAQSDRPIVSSRTDIVLDS